MYAFKFLPLFSSPEHDRRYHLHYERGKSCSLRIETPPYCHCHTSLPLETTRQTVLWQKRVLHETSPPDTRKTKIDSPYSTPHGYDKKDINGLFIPTNEKKSPRGRDRVGNACRYRYSLLPSLNHAQTSTTRANSLLLWSTEASASASLKNATYQGPAVCPTQRGDAQGAIVSAQKRKRIKRVQRFCGRDATHENTREKTMQQLP